jgi:hypothetical protein
LTATVLLSDTPTSKRDKVALDSGASDHIINSLDRFIPGTMRRINGSVKLGDGKVLQVDSIGTAFVGLLELTNALYLPLFTITLVSVNKLTLQNITSTFSPTSCQVTDAATHEVIVEMQSTNGLYFLPPDLNPTEHQAHAITRSKAKKVQEKISTYLWHQCLGHCNHATMKRLLGDSLSKPDKSICDVCIKSKQTQKFPRQPAARSTIPFKLVHSDLCGELDISQGRTRYCIFYIDDCTRHVTTYYPTSKTKEEINEKFEHYLVWMKAQDYQMKRFRYDNGTGEYRNSMMIATLAREAIQFEPVPPYSQHKNGVAERMIHTLITKCRAMLLDAKVPFSFWPEAMEMAIHLHRRIPIRTLNWKLPYEALYKKKPTLDHL